jgi:hypothetical protein
LSVKVFDAKKKEISLEEMENAEEEGTSLGVNLQGREKK